MEKPHKPYTDAQKMYNVQNKVMLNTFDMHSAYDVNKCVVFYNNLCVWADTVTAVDTEPYMCVNMKVCLLTTWL